MSAHTCDWCSEPATRITAHERPNTGPLEAYWCERHFAENRKMFGSKVANDESGK